MTTTRERLVAVVTGGGRGIGRAVAARLAADGYRLELCGLDAGELETCAAELGADVVIHAEAVDLRDRAAQDAWVAGVGERHESLDVLVHVAGVGGPDPAGDDEAAAHLDHVLAVNATAVARLTRELSARLRTDGRGRVVVVASVLGKMGVPGFTAYGASKAAAIGLTRAMALDLAPRRITVNAVCPGWTDTAMARQGFEAIAASSGASVEDARAEVERGLPLGRIVRPDEVAALVAFLASAEPGAMSGQAVTMSSGDLQA